MIKVSNITKTFNDIEVLHTTSLTINKGDFIAVVGPSGSGKSTLLYSVSGMDPVSSGTVTFDGTNISEMGEEELANFRLHRMGFVFQNSHMLKNLSILDNITLPALVANKHDAKEVRRYAKELMKRMEIEGLENRYINEVSGGQLQRASICRAMINKPDILFLDEPTGALNQEVTNQVLQILEGLNKDGMTIMVVTHDFNVAQRAKKIIQVKDGKIVA
jgi:putative ABC transport system ATP-binding protein